MKLSLIVKSVESLVDPLCAFLWYVDFDNIPYYKCKLPSLPLQHVVLRKDLIAITVQQHLVARLENQYRADRKRTTLL